MEIVKKDNPYMTVIVYKEELLCNGHVDLPRDYRCISTEESHEYLAYILKLKLTDESILFRKFDSDVNIKKEILYRRFN